ncbi:MAG: 2-dehydropantoate 2-reductase [Alsobacter sp.]
MRVAIYGAGAIGGLLAAKLAQSGVDVTVIARGPHLSAMQAHGLTLVSDGVRKTVHPRCLADPTEAGIQDYVFVTLKAHALPGAARAIGTMVGPDTVIVPGVNGVPYWYFYGLEGPYRDRRIEAVDPGGALWDVLPPERVVGCVVYPAAAVAEPGVIEHSYGDRFTLGEPDGSRSARVEALSKLLIAAGLKAPVRPRIRDEIWLKLWGNMAFNPLSALTLATLDTLATQQDLRDVARAMMLEGQSVAESLGVRFAIGVDRRIEGAAEVGAHKTSMLQDLELGRPMEVDALLGAVVELGEMVGQAMPTCRIILALLRQRARMAARDPA